MSITIIKVGDHLRVLEASAPIPENTPMQFFTSQEFHEMEEHRAMLALQAAAFIRGDEDESAEDLFLIE